MKKTRIAIIAAGVLLPFLARVPGGSAWIDQYIRAGELGILFIQAFYAFTWGSILAFS